MARGKPDRNGIANVRRSPRRGPGLAGHVVDSALLDVLGQDPVPRSAYQLASRLHDVGLNLPAMSVYRALDRLVAQDLVQKVETLSAYRLRDKPKAVLMICMACGRTTSLSAPTQHDGLSDLVADQGFLVSRLALEAAGECGECRAANVATA